MRLKCLTIAALLGATSAAVAAPYETFVDIETEEDLYDLYAAQQIGDDTFETLLALLQRGVDLNEASREELYTLPNLTYNDVDAIVAYRETTGRIEDPIVLVGAGVITDQKLLGIAAFLLLEPRSKFATEVKGFARLQTRWSLEDGGTPPVGLRARASSLRNLTVGLAATLDRQRMGDIVYDPNRDALLGDPATTRPRLGKFYAQWRAEDFEIIGGNYRAGFGQSLTFDNSSDYTPNGIYGDDEMYRDDSLTKECKESQGELTQSPCSGEPGDIYITPDFRFREAMLGVAAGTDSIAVGGGGHLQFYGFVSHQPRSIYQYEIYDRARCADPTDDADPSCAAPYVYKRQDDLLKPTSRFSFQTLPNMYRETLAGGNATYFAARRIHYGVTAYGAGVKWLTQGMDLDFQEWSRTPYGGGYGAVGFDMAWGHKWLDVFFEGAHSFDSMPDGGGPAAIVRATATRKKEELEFAFRYYDKAFANPYASPISAPDEYDGLRARDELGGRVKYTGLLDKRLQIRASADVWTQPSKEIVKTQFIVRADVKLNSEISWGYWGEFQDKNLAESGRDQCYEISTEEDERGEPIPCGGMKLQNSGRLRWTQSKKLWVSAQAQHELLDEGRYDSKFRQDLSAWLLATYKPAPEMRFRTRLRYLFEDISDNEFLEQSFWTYVDLTYRLRKKDNMRIRYDLLVWLDDRANTLDRKPSPEHRLWAEYEAKF